jgi:DNA-binding GntR family transcriptional regulator
VTVVARTVLREQVKDVLLERILEGEYAPGDRLVETRIAHELGTSQAPVREALRELAALRFVETEPFRSARVRAVSPLELAEAYPVRAALEELAASEAAGRMYGDVEELEDELEAMREAARDGDLRRQIAHDVAFHRKIVAAAGNQTLLEVWSSLHIEARTTVTLVKTHIDPETLAELHVPILEAIRSGDCAVAAAASRRHFDGFRELMEAGS